MPREFEERKGASFPYPTLFASISLGIGLRDIYTEVPV